MDTLTLESTITSQEPSYSLQGKKPAKSVQTYNLPKLTFTMTVALSFCPDESVTVSLKV